MDGILALLRGRLLLPRLLIVAFLISCGGEEDDGPPVDPNAPPEASEIQTSVSRLEMQALGAKAQIVATVFDKEGFEIEGVPLNWSSSAPAVAEVDKAGVVTAVGNGECVISVRALGVVAEVEVRIEQVPDSLVLQPRRLSFDAIGASQQLSAAVLDAGEAPVADAKLQWKSVDPEIATVDETGLVVARSAGRTEIGATVEGSELVGVVEVSVEPVAVRSGVRVVVPPHFVSGVPNQVQVEITDREGVPVETGEFTVTLALGENPAGGKLTGTLSVQAEKGVATFKGLRIDKAAPGYTLVAQVSGLDLAESVPFDVLPGAPARLQLLSQPSRVVSLQPFSPPLRFEIVDAAGNRVSGEPEVQVSLVQGPEGQLGGSTTVRAVAGVATFDRIQIDKAGRGYVLRASAPGIEAAESGAVEVVPGLATKLGFLVHPASTAAGKAIDPAVLVEVLDAADNRVEDSSRSISVVLAPHASDAQLSGENTQSTVDGVATFSNLVVDRAGSGMRLIAMSAEMEEVESLPFDVGAGEPQRLVFHLHPGNGVSGEALPAFEVRAVDRTGTFTPDATGVVTISLEKNPGDAQISGNRSLPLQGGRVVFDDIRIDRAASGYTLSATAANLDKGESNPFRIDPGEPASLRFLVQPSTVGSLLPMVPAPQVEILDEAGNRTQSNLVVTLQLATNPAGAALESPQQVAAVDGVATFDNLRIDRAGSGFRLLPSAGPLSGNASDPFSVTAGEPQRLSFSVTPSVVEAGLPFSPALEVEVQDSAGNRVASSGQLIEISLEEGPAGGKLSGITQVLTENGIARFTNLSLDRASEEESYRLKVSGAGLLGASSDPIRVQPGPAVKLVFHHQPTAGTAGAPLPPVEVRLLDEHDNWNQNAGGTVTVSLNPNPTGGQIAGDRSVPVVGGRAVFDNLRIDKAGSGYGLRATATGMAGATSDLFQVQAGAAAGLVFVGAPGNAISGQPIPGVEVEVQDTWGNRVFDASHPITISRSRGPNGNLTGELTVFAQEGRAVFDNLRLDLAGSGYALVASSGSWVSADSAFFSVGPGAGQQLAFRVQPSQGVVGLALDPAVEVEVRDAAGNLTTESGHLVQLSLAQGPEGAAISGGLSAATVQGVATFPALFLNKAGGGYRLLATAEGLTEKTSEPFSVAPGSGEVLSFLVQPTDGRSGEPLAEVKVQVLDAGGNPSPNATGTITLSLVENHTGATLSGVVTASLVNGVATFSQLLVDKVGSGYALRATSDEYATTTSDVFSISAGEPAKLAFLSTPPVVVSGQAFLEPVRVAILDAAGNLTDATHRVELSLENAPRPDQLDGPSSQQAEDGVASFPGLKLHLAAEGYTLRAEAEGLFGAVSEAIEVVAGPAVELAFMTLPEVGTAGELLPAVRVAFLDAAGNRVLGRSDEVTLALASGPGTLGGNRIAAAEQGLAIFDELVIQQAGLYTLLATSGSLVSPISASFEVVASTAKKLAFRVQPTDTYPNFAIRPAVEVEIQDAYGNLVASREDAVTLSLVNNPGGAVLGGDPTVNAIEGVATFNNLLLDKMGQGYTLRASSGTLEPVESVIFDVVESKATTLAFVTQPQDTPAGELLNEIQVEILDENGNRLDANLPVTLSLATAPEGGVLGGTLTVYAVHGLASFSNLAITKTGVGYSLKASLNDIVAYSEPFEILSGLPKGVVWYEAPQDAVSGSPIVGATANFVAVEIVDRNGERVTNYEGSVTISVGAGPTGAYLQGNLTTTAFAGRAQFPGLSIDRAGTYRLLVLPEDVPPSLSPSFEILPGQPTRMRFLDTLSGSFPAGEPLPPLRVAIEDDAGNRTDSSQSLELRALGGAGNVQLGGNPTKAAEEGLATFDDITIDQAGVYHLVVDGFGLSPRNGSGVFLIEAGAVEQLEFARQPAGGKARAALPAVEVVLLDAWGNQTSSNQEVTLTLAGGSAGALLSGTTTKAATNGKVIFDDLEISHAGTGYRLVASIDSPVRSKQSSTFEVLGGVPHALVWERFPAAGVSGEVLSPSVEVRVVDEFGEVVETFDDWIEISIASGPVGGVLSGTTGGTATAGVAVFDELELDRAGTYTLRARAPSLQSVPELLSSPLPIVAGPPAHLIFQRGPFNSRSLVAMQPAVEVAILDAAGNLVEDADETVTLRLDEGSAGGAQLQGGSASPVGGIATFDGLSVDKVGDYMLIASIGAMDSLPSIPFRVDPGSPYALQFIEQPVDHQVGTEFSTAVRLLDEAGNETQGQNLIGLELKGGDPAATLGGQREKAASFGIAAFDSLVIDTMGVGYYLEASSGDLEPDTSAPFEVRAGAPAGLVWLNMPPASATAGENLGPLQVEVVDAFGNRVADYEESLVLDLLGGGTVLGDTEVDFEGGLATIGQIWVERAGAGYQLLAQSGAFAPVGSTAFDIVPDRVDRLEFLAVPQGGFAGTILSKVELVALDRFDNPVAESVEVTLSLGGGEPTAQLHGNRIKTTEGGFVSFTDLYIDEEGEDYFLEALAPGVTPISSATFSIDTGCAGGLQRCGEACVDIQEDEAHCGGCFQACEGEALCREGSCVVECAAGMTICQGVCVDLETDPLSCGACGAPCEEGQTCLLGACVDEPDLQIANWPLPPNMPSRYVVRQETVRDEITGLIWERETPIKSANQNSAASYCENLELEGRRDWRLPTVIELLTLVDNSRVNPAYSGVFPAVNGNFWTDTPRAGSTSYWYINFASGTSGTAARDNTYAVRCVRGGAGNNEERYAVANHTVYDTKTQLTWQRRAFADTFTFEEAAQACGELVVGGFDDWRVPTKKELESLVTWSRISPAIDTETFLDTASANYWTASAFPEYGPDEAWQINFDTGAASIAAVGTRNRLRCVRDDKPESIVCPGRGEAPCGGLCVALASDVANCGACGNVCGAGMYCVDGRCSEEANYEWATWPLPPDNPSNYNPMTQETATDPLTGLVWQRHGPGIRFTQDEAKEYCRNLRLEGLDGWRLPSAIELLSLVDFSVLNGESHPHPVINASAFPGTFTTTSTSSSYQTRVDNDPGYWSSSPRALSESEGWWVGFYNGRATTASKDTMKYARCVRGEPPPQADRYVIEEDTVYDIYTGLYWERRALPYSFNRGGADTYCDNHLQGRTDWRLPTKRELESLIDRRNAGVGYAIDRAAFPGNAGGNFWAAGNPSGPRAYVSFSSGGTGITTDNSGLRVRCVRDSSTWEDTCDAGKTLCDHMCVDTQSHQYHCGGCGNACEVTEYCSEGSCVPLDKNLRAKWPIPPETLGAADFDLSDPLLAIDLRTGLTWQRRHTAPRMNHYDAEAYCRHLNYAGYADWRLPSLVELQSITTVNRYRPAFPTSVFQDMPTGSNDHWWTNQPTAWDPNLFQVVRGDGGNTYLSRTDVQFVRCVRGGPVGSEQPWQLFDEYAVDPNTGLMWSRSYAGTMNYANAESYCAAAIIGGLSGWRVPTLKELYSFTDYSRSAPAFDPDLYGGPSYSDRYFWTSSVYHTSSPSSSNWRLTFDGGTSSTQTRTTSTSMYVRCVRDWDG